MEDFDFNMDNEFGTSVSKLKENNTNQEDIINNNPILESDIDYDKIIENLHNSDTFIQKQNNNINVKHFVKNLENNLDNFNNINNDSIPFYPNNVNTLNFNEKDLSFSKNHDFFNNKPMPSNFTKNMLPKKNNIPNYTHQKNNTSNNIYEKYLKCEYIDLIIYGILFILFNNKIITELINKIFKIQNDNANLLLRTIIFVIIIYFIKKYNL